MKPPPKPCSAGRADTGMVNWDVEPALVFAMRDRCGAPNIRVRSAEAESEREGQKERREPEIEGERSAKSECKRQVGAASPDRSAVRAGAAKQHSPNGPRATSTPAFRESIVYVAPSAH